jgi:anti-sigma factor RsiW
MNMKHIRENMLEHREVSSLIPWYVNARIGDGERQRVEAHLRTCAECRGELLQQRQVQEAMTADPGVEYMPTASLKRLQSRLDELEAAPSTTHEPSVERTARRSNPRRWSMAASIAVMAAAASILAAALWTHFQIRALPSDYYTVTAPAPRAPQEVIRAVFAPATTLVELQAILGESQLRIIAGPTEAGVYSLAANSKRPVSSSLALLRANAAVRFAEATQPTAVPDHPQ